MLNVVCCILHAQVHVQDNYIPSCAGGTLLNCHHLNTLIRPDQINLLLLGFAVCIFGSAGKKLNRVKGWTVGLHRANPPHMLLYCKKARPGTHLSVCVQSGCRILLTKNMLHFIGNNVRRALPVPKWGQRACGRAASGQGNDCRSRI